MPFKKLDYTEEFKKELKKLWKKACIFFLKIRVNPWLKLELLVFNSVI
jgi:hypothetical protein